MSKSRIPSPHGERVRALRLALKEAGLDAFLAIHPPSVRYLSGFESTFAELVIDARDATVITDGRYAEAARDALPGWRVLCIPRDGLDDWNAQFWRKHGYARIGFEGTMTWSRFDRLRRQTRPARLVESEKTMLELRRVKDEAEAKRLRRAARLADDVMQRAFDILKPGLSEIDIARFIKRTFEDIGADGESFPCIVASGPNSSRPHHHPGPRRLREGDAVTLDIGALYNGYCSDITRTVVLGRASKAFRAAYEACLSAQMEALAAVRPGVACKDLDAVARKNLERAGYGDAFVHGLGHGVGLEIHEAPALNSRSKDMLAEGMAITIEPGIYLAGRFGVRIEDFALVGPKGPVLLSKTPKELLEIG